MMINSPDWAIVFSMKSMKWLQVCPGMP